MFLGARYPFPCMRRACCVSMCLPSRICQGTVTIACPVTETRVVGVVDEVEFLRTSNLHVDTMGILG